MKDLPPPGTAVLGALVRARECWVRLACQNGPDILKQRVDGPMIKAFAQMSDDIPTLSTQLPMAAGVELAGDRGGGRRRALRSAAI
ncbi:hypothetical protein KCP77_11915 [Salmonella enterica subsp. enterica]|nr:hypothetical protein KCP77_11915 [Salmonella enterica subsp. enterica]